MYSLQVPPNGLGSSKVVWAEGALEAGCRQVTSFHMVDDVDFIMRPKQVFTFRVEALEAVDARDFVYKRARGGHNGVVVNWWSEETALVWTLG